MRRDWNEFWFKPCSPVPLGLFRLLFGLLALAYALMLFPDRWLWFSEQGALPLAVSNRYNGAGAGGYRLELLNWTGADHVLTLFFVVFLLASLGLTLGLWTRPCAFVVFLCLNSLHNRNNVIHNSGDTVMMVMSIYLVLAPSGAACSLDRLWRIFKGQEGDQPPLVVPWVQRLMQLQVSIVYACTGLSKSSGSLWQEGTAAYYPLQLPESARFKMPLMDANHLWAINLLTWGTVASELALGFLIWVPRLRLYVLALGVLLHLGIEYSLNIPLFSFLMIASYLVFLSETDIKNFLAWVQKPLGVTPLRLVFDGECDFCRSALLVVRFLDVFRLVTFLDSHDPAQLARAEGVRFQDAENAAIAVDPKGRQFVGFYAFRAIAWQLPATWLLAPLLYIPGIPWLGRRVYAWVVRNRSRLPVAPRYKVTGPGHKSVPSHSAFGETK